MNRPTFCSDRELLARPSVLSWFDNMTLVASANELIKMPVSVTLTSSSGSVIPESWCCCVLRRFLKNCMSRNRPFRGLDIVLDHSNCLMNLVRRAVHGDRHSLDQHRRATSAGASAGCPRTWGVRQNARAGRVVLITGGDERRVPALGLQCCLHVRVVVALDWSTVQPVGGVLQDCLRLGGLAGPTGGGDTGGRSDEQRDHDDPDQDDRDDHLDEREAFVARSVDGFVLTISSPDHSKLHCSPPGMRPVGMTSPCLRVLSVQCATQLSEKLSRFGHIIHKVFEESPLISGYDRRLRSWQRHLRRTAARAVPTGPSPAR